MSRNRQTTFVHPLLDKIQTRASSRIALPDSTRFVVDVDSDLASAMLVQRPESQRKPDDATIRRYTKDMESGAWRTDLAEPFTFDVNLSFLNGQHRALAVVAASTDRPFVLRNAAVVVLATDASTMALPLDCGKRRTRQNYERSLGITLPKSVSAGLLFDAMNFARFRLNSIPHPEQARIVFEHPLRDRIIGIRKISCQPAGCVAAVARCVARGGDDAVEFFEHVFENNHMIRGRESAGARNLSTWLLESSRKKYAGDLFMREAAIRTIRSWNDHRSGKSFKYQRTPKAGDEIPEALA